jgi:hypothetical protein
MLQLLEPAVMEAFVLVPEFFLLFGAPDVPRRRRRRFITVRSGRESVQVPL